ncbi:VOC family protein [Saccharomonospora sp. NB11]|jgi:PhnB protein|uniref:VOC family protein n=1 Tax=Saccharomonospora sp. NB11 TaxID=1642298 RepID=UPI0018D07816|nr:VOC family protein [Saccharomonospora sp. NB11]
MVSRLNPYLTFSGNAREAMEFYRSVFGGDLDLTTFGQFGAADSPEADKVMHAALETDHGFTLMGSDVPSDQDYTPGNNVTVSISGDDTETLRGYWAKLSEGATVLVPLEKQMWGDEFGMCVDRFGIPWLVDIAVPD